MTELEQGLSRVLEEHRHESGLHVIGGQRRLLDRLVEFFEHGLGQASSEPEQKAQS